MEGFARYYIKDKLPDARREDYEVIGYIFTSAYVPLIFAIPQKGDSFR